jgi:hypothetical protein
MNHSLAVFLISKDVRAVKVVYKPGKDAARYTFKTFDPTIQVDDYVVVPTGDKNIDHMMKVCKVVETDIEPDFDSSADFKWIVAKVDRTAYEKTLEDEGDAIAKIRSAEKRRRRKELAKDLLDDEGAAELKALPISTINGDLPEPGADPAPKPTRDEDDDEDYDF